MAIDDLSGFGIDAAQEGQGELGNDGLSGNVPSNVICDLIRSHFCPPHTPVKAASKQLSLSARMIFRAESVLMA